MWQVEREDDKILGVSERQGRERTREGLIAPPLDTCQCRLGSEPWNFLQSSLLVVESGRLSYFFFVAT